MIIIAIEQWPLIRMRLVALFTAAAKKLVFKLAQLFFQIMDFFLVLYFEFIMFYFEFINKRKYDIFGQTGIIG